MSTHGHDQPHGNDSNKKFFSYFAREERNLAAVLSLVFIVVSVSAAKQADLLNTYQTETQYNLYYILTWGSLLMSGLAAFRCLK